MPTLLLSGRDVRSLLGMSDVLVAVENAFRDWAKGAGSMPPKAYLSLEKGDFRAMPAALPGAAGVKWVNVHTGNATLGLPTVMAIIIYSDPDTGYPLAIMDGTDITAYRTGAAAAIAAKHLARPGSRSLGIIGAGRQAYTQILAHAELFRLERIKAYDISPDAVRRLKESMPGYPIVEASLEEAAACDIVCTLTPARRPFLKESWVLPGTHINAVGADAEGKQELEPSLLKKAMVVVDDLRQAVAAGEINVPVSRGLYSAAEIYGTLGEVVSGQKPGRRQENAITIFDSTGVAIEDIAVAKLVYDRAIRSGNYQTIDLI